MSDTPQTQTTAGPTQVVRWLTLAIDDIKAMNTQAEKVLTALVGGFEKGTANVDFKSKEWRKGRLGTFFCTLQAVAKRKTELNMQAELTQGGYKTRYEQFRGAQKSVAASSKEIPALLDGIAAAQEILYKCYIDLKLAEWNATKTNAAIRARKRAAGGESFYSGRFNPPAVDFSDKFNKLQ